MKGLSRSEKVKYLALLQERERRINTYKIKSFTPYPWQRKFYKAGKTAFQRLLMAANQVGKSDCGASEVAYHLTGLYPADWAGMRFDFPPLVWSLGVSGETLKENNQLKLFGDLTDEGFINSGYIGNSLIDIPGIIRSHQARGLAKEVRVKHVSGGYSKVIFKSYSQGQHALMGPVVDFIHIDEEPEDPEIYPQCLTRTTNGNKGQGGYIIMTFTPENGVTLLIDQFTNRIGKGQFLLNVTWNDAPHITAERKAQLLDAIPDYQRDMRTKGVPLMGSGVVFPIGEERIKGYIPGLIKGKDIPRRFFRIGGIDFAYGGEHPAAVAYLAYDADKDIIYVYDGFRAQGLSPVEMSSRMRKFEDWIPIAYPHDGEAVKIGKGGTYKKTADQYREEGINMLDQHSTFADGCWSLEAGLTEMYIRMKTGRFFVDPNLTEFFEEFRLYHRKNGQVVREKDDFISAVRYAFMMFDRFAEREPLENEDREERGHSSDNAMGY